MVRGHAKEVAQQKNAAKQAALKKSGTQKASQTFTHGAAEKKLNFLCPLCKWWSSVEFGGGLSTTGITVVPTVALQSTMVNYIQMKQHYDSKHPKERVPEESSFAAS
ncbi:hypothetical protein EMIHUDRAFT_206933 [Emiliania huxleyi CCMP1516]|uniref:Small EDRK-rich factor-like N-terminal domain-containing protein n=2 Tax=Emiliania huxleyi TaxID=2903 RepID=A0A0D3JKA1_EMIH1|nr:hypothetical protein EMIHUDRAFT_206933 [Emiliania huxleyi CCMP1516]EOD23936.1 hypothetical protein EMIHUDRAFT_206933 [Emiliania huxleyi CCMP1516]|eukprot:XP_005776365.1 hypothetical protein EMIHUDRAFT_206933 [Emiliania huxleyi CCMP1516]